MTFSRKEPETVKAIRIGDSDVWVLPCPDKFVRFRVPVPPSCNARQRPVYKVRRSRWGGTYTSVELGLTTEALGYFQNALALKLAWKKVMAAPVEDYTKMEFKFYLANMAYDTHNGLKLACDMMQKAGLVLNDKYILPQVDVPEKAPGDPRLIITFSTENALPEDRGRRLEPPPGGDIS